MQLQVTTGETDHITESTATYAVMLPTKYTDLSGMGMASMLGPVEMNADGRREYKVIRDAVDKAVSAERNITGPRLVGKGVLVAHRLNGPVAELTGAQVKAYADRDLSHLVRKMELRENHVYRDSEPVKFVVEVPGDGGDMDGRFRRRLGPRGELRAPYLIGTATVEADGVMKAEAHLDAAYTAFTGTDHDIGRLADDASIRVWEATHNAGGVKYTH